MIAAQATLPNLVQRTRSNHSLEHATVALLLQHMGPQLRVLGRSTPYGFYLYGDLPTHLVQQFAHEALARLKGGESELAISPFCGTNYATAGADTTWYVVVFATLAARARGEDEANDHRRAFLCALARRAPLTFRSAEVDAAVSFAPGSVETPPVVTYLAQMDLTPAACAQTKAKY